MKEQQLISSKEEISAGGVGTAPNPHSAFRIPQSGDVVTLAHGAGGKLSSDLIRKVFQKHFTSRSLLNMEDGAAFPGTGRLCMTTDAFVVNPPLFPGGDIGKLAVTGIANDLSVEGAVPKFLSLSFILEEGLPLTLLEQIAESAAEQAAEIGMEVIAADTKVVENGSADSIYIAGTGIGQMTETALDVNAIAPGDQIIVTGSLGDHEMALLAHRYDFQVDFQSDCAPLNRLLEPLYTVPDIRWMRDPTRGGIASQLHELALKTQIEIELREEALPFKKGVRYLADVLGMDLLYAASEGRAVIIASPRAAEQALETLRGIAGGEDAAIVGQVVSHDKNLVKMRTRLGATRILPFLSGGQYPRIC